MPFQSMQFYLVYIKLFVDYGEDIEENLLVLLHFKYTENNYVGAAAAAANIKPKQNALLISLFFFKFLIFYKTK